MLKCQDEWSLTDAKKEANWDDFTKKASFKCCTALCALQLSIIGHLEITCGLHQARRDSLGTRLMDMDYEPCTVHHQIWTKDSSCIAILNCINHDFDEVSTIPDFYLMCSQLAVSTILNSVSQISELVSRGCSTLVLFIGCKHHWGQKNLLTYGIIWEWAELLIFIYKLRTC